MKNKKQTDRKPRAQHIVRPRGVSGQAHVTSGRGKPAREAGIVQHVQLKDMGAVLKVSYACRGAQGAHLWQDTPLYWLLGMWPAAVSCAALCFAEGVAVLCL